MLNGHEGILQQGSAGLSRVCRQGLLHPNSISGPRPSLGEERSNGSTWLLNASYSGLCLRIRIVTAQHNLVILELVRAQTLDSECAIAMAEMRYRQWRCGAARLRLWHSSRLLNTSFNPLFAGTTKGSQVSRKQDACENAADLSLRSHGLKWLWGNFTQDSLLMSQVVHSSQQAQILEVHKSLAYFGP